MNLLLYAGALLIRGLQSLIVLPAFSSRVGAEGYGAFSQIVLAVGLLAPIAGFRLETAAVRILSSQSQSDKFRHYFYSGAISVVLAGILVFGLTLIPSIGEVGADVLLGSTNHRRFIPFLGSLLLVNLTETYLLSYFRIVDRMHILSAILMLQAIIESALIILLITSGYGTEAAIAVMIVVEAVVCIVIGVIIYRNIGGIAFHRFGLQQMLKYSLPLIPNGGTRWLVNYADRLIITQVLGLAAVGIYSASYSLSMGIHFLVAPIGFVLFPILSRLWDEGEFEEVRRYFRYATRYFLLLSIPSCIGLTFLSPDILRLIANEEFFHSRWLVFWLTSGIVFNGIFQINVYVFHLVHQTMVNTFILAVGSLLNIGLNILFVPWLGLISSAVATAITFFLMAIVSLWYGRRLIGYKIDMGSILKSISASIVMVLVLRLLPPTNWIMISGMVIVAIAVYVLLLFLMRTFSRMELTHLFQLFTAP